MYQQLLALWCHGFLFKESDHANESLSESRMVLLVIMIAVDGKIMMKQE